MIEIFFMSAEKNLRSPFLFVICTSNSISMRILIFIHFVLITTATIGQVNIPEVYLELDKAHQEEDYQKIINLKEEALKQLEVRQDSILAEAYTIIGDAHYTVGDLENAVQEYKNGKNQSVQVCCVI